MMGCISGKWVLHCTKTFKIGYSTFESGKDYNVKDKFPGADRTIETGIWEVKDGHGGLVNIDMEKRKEYFAV